MKNAGTHPALQPRPMSPERVRDLLERAGRTGRGVEGARKAIATKRRDHLCPNCVQRGHFADECVNPTHPTRSR